MLYSKKTSSNKFVLNLQEHKKDHSFEHSSSAMSVSMLGLALEVGIYLERDEIGSLKRREELLGHLCAPCESIFRFHIFYLLILNDISQRFNKPITEITLEDVCMLEHQHMLMTYPLNSDGLRSERDTALGELLNSFHTDRLPPTKGLQRHFFRNVILTNVLHGLLGEQLQRLLKKVQNR